MSNTRGRRGGPGFQLKGGKTLGVRLDAETIEALDRIREWQGLSYSSIIRSAIKVYLESWVNLKTGRDLLGNPVNLEEISRKGVVNEREGRP